MIDGMKRFTPFTESELKIEKKGDDEHVIRGYAALFDVETGAMFNNLNGVKEVIRQGFFGPALALDEPILALWNHNENYILGERSAGTMQIDQDSRGLPFEAMIPDSQRIRDVVVGPIVRGEVRGCSFQALVDYDFEEYDRKSNTIILNSGGARQLIDVGPVAKPAYTATEVEARSARVRSKIRKIEPVLITENSIEYQEFMMMRRQS